MKRAPEDDLQAAMRTRLISVFNGTVSVVSDQDTSSFNSIEDRIMDNADDHAAYPFIRFGEHRIEMDDYDCIENAHHVVRIHVFSDEGGKQQAKLIAHLIRKALHEYSLTLTDNGLSNIYVRDTSYAIEPDGRRVQAIVNITADIEDQTS